MLGFLVMSATLWWITKNVYLSVLILVPIFVIVLTHEILTWTKGLTARYVTRIDGIIIQILFTLAGSFMPLSSEMAPQGDKRKDAIAATTSLLVLLFLAFVCYFTAVLTGSLTAAYLADLFVIFPMVHSFPIPPLDGDYIFKHNKGLWAGFWGVTLLSFSVIASDVILAVI